MDSVTIQKLLVTTQEDIADLYKMSDIHFNRILIAIFISVAFFITTITVDYYTGISLVLLSISICKVIYEIVMFSFIRYSIRHKTSNYKKILKKFTEFENENT